MVSVASSEFTKHFGRYRDETQRNSVAITIYGRTTGYFLSAHEFDIE